MAQIIYLGQVQMEEETSKCNICSRETTSIITCVDCFKLTQATHDWLRSLLRDRKKLLRQEINRMVRMMAGKIDRITNRTLKEWGMKNE